MSANGSGAALGQRAIVIGAGMGGMAAAAALSTTFDEVIVFERDHLPEEAEPRSGTPQGMQGHILLTGGLLALCELFPGFDQELLASGAETIRAGLDFRIEQGAYIPFPQRDLGWEFYGASRPLYEHVVRKHLAKIPNITIRTGCRVDEILASDDQSSVIGVRIAGPQRELETVATDFVLDASSHGLLTLKLLERTGRTKPDEDLILVDLGYASAMFERPENPDRDFKMMLTTPSPPSDSKSALLLPVEGDRWMLTLIGRGDEIPPGDWEGYMAFVETLRTPTIKLALQGAKPIGRVWGYRFSANIRRRFERLGDLPGNFLPFADVICRTNPAAGQGMTVAAKEALVMKALLQGRAEAGRGLGGLAEEFFAGTRQFVDHAWALVAAQDFLFPSTKGDRTFADYSGKIFNPELFGLASLDADLHRLWQQVAHLLQPMSKLSDALAERRASRPGLTEAVAENPGN